MPLIVVTGHPSSGKTHRANQIKADFESRIAKLASSEPNIKRKVAVIPSHHSSQDPGPTSESVLHSQSSNLRDQLYNHSSAEKVARAEEFSAIKRALNRNDVVIADGLNYIKGFRYQLWCEAKAAATRCVVVHVAAREDECEGWNRERVHAWEWDFPEEKEHQSQQGEEMKVGGINVRVGRNVMGELEPESHTAIYGDRVVEYSGNRSRSSSMGGGGVSDEDDQNQLPEKRAQNGDTMTLKSLYITDSTQDLDATTSQNVVGTLQSLSEESALSTNGSSVAPIEPPPPKSALPYAPSTLKSLLMRYEPPSPFTRWDTPLFTVPTSDTHPPYEAIWTAILPAPTKLTSKKALSQHHQQQHRSQSLNDDPPAVGKIEPVRQHAATILPRATTSDALQVLESSTADVVKTILTAAREQGISNGEGGDLTFTIGTRPSSTKVTTSIMTPDDNDHHHHHHHQSNNTDDKNDTPHNGTNSTEKHDANDSNSDTIALTLPLPLNTPLSQPMLQRLRRKYTQIQRGSIAHGQGHVSGREDVIRNFTLFLQSEWDT